MSSQTPEEFAALLKLIPEDHMLVPVEMGPNGTRALRVRVLYEYGFYDVIEIPRKQPHA